MLTRCEHDDGDDLTREYDDDNVAVDDVFNFGDKDDDDGDDDDGDHR